MEAPESPFPKLETLKVCCHKALPQALPQEDLWQLVAAIWLARIVAFTIARHTLA